MKTILYLLTPLFLFCGMTLQGYQPSRGSVLVDEVIAKAAEVVKKEYGLHPCGSGASMPGGPIRKINLVFDSNQSYSRDQLRALLVKIW